MNSNFTRSGFSDLSAGLIIIASASKSHLFLKKYCKPACCSKYAHVSLALFARGASDFSSSIRFDSRVDLNSSIASSSSVGTFTLDEISSVEASGSDSFVF